MADNQWRRWHKDARRFFEEMFPMGDGGHILKVGNIVRLLKPPILSIPVPVGAIGVIREVETEGIMAEKGKNYAVMFDLSPLKIPFNPSIAAMIRKENPEIEIPEHHGEVTLYLSYHSIIPVPRNELWLYLVSKKTRNRIGAMKAYIRFHRRLWSGYYDAPSSSDAYKREEWQVNRALENAGVTIELDYSFGCLVFVFDNSRIPITSGILRIGG